MRGLALAAVCWLVSVCLVTTQSRAAYPGTLDQHPAIDYRGGTVNDVVTSLQREIAAGTTSLAFEGQQGYLRSLLEKLNVPVDSQLLLFSKTGIQSAHTGPDNPRALYFNDRVVVGYIPGAPMIEMASHDPRQGVIFQTLLQSPEAVRIARPERCAGCHLSANSLDVPGILVRSVFVAGDGRSLPQLGSFLVDHRSPLEQRWGGWYVTGTHGGARHMGNAVVIDPANPDAAISDQTLNRTTVDSRVDLTAYPAATSDIAALLVFDHQGRAINLLTRLGWESRAAATDGRLDFSQGDLREALRETVDYLLFADAAKLASPVQGVASFSKAFGAGGPRDRQGRSLRELDLQTRLFKYGCSYMIYSPAVDALPGEVRAELFRQMRLRLTDPVTLAILDDTKAGWR
ncbi:MAG: hypothetical protein ABI039_04080 [Vicinamibacterales bacterium]